MAPLHHFSRPSVMVTAGRIPHLRAINPFCEVRLAFYQQMITRLSLILRVRLEENLARHCKRAATLTALRLRFYYCRQKTHQNLLQCEQRQPPSFRILPAMLNASNNVPNLGFIQRTASAVHKQKKKKARATDKSAVFSVFPGFNYHQRELETSAESGWL